MRGEAFDVSYIEKRIERVPFSGCWIWLRGLQTHGHGVARFRGAATTAHRVSWTIFRGDPGQMCVLHRCDVPACVNPEHLFLGTRADNVADMDAKGRRGNRKLTESQARAALSLKGSLTGRALADRLGVSEATISLLWARKSWLWLDAA